MIQDREAAMCVRARAFILVYAFVHSRVFVRVPVCMYTSQLSGHILRECPNVVLSHWLLQLVVTACPEE